MENWAKYWEDLLVREKLKSKVGEIDLAYRRLGLEQSIESICRRVYDRYDREFEPRLKATEKDLLTLLHDLDGVHLLTSRVKSRDSLLCKVIVNVHKNINSPHSPYTRLTGENVEHVITDLLGLRFIVGYRGNWKTVHQGILGSFPLLRDDKAWYLENQPFPFAEQLPSPGAAGFQAEWPKAYHAEGDDISEFAAAGLETRLHEKGYRSVHYTVCFHAIYVELQVRTIYDEAWSDVDHRYVYKQEANVSSEALQELSKILCQFTNVCNDIGEEMRKIYEGSPPILRSRNKQRIAGDEALSFFDGSIDRLEHATKALRIFRESLHSEANAEES